MENQILDYNKRFAQIQRGVDTDWMVLPLRNAFDLKLLTIENLDKRAVGPIYEAVKDWDEPVAIAVLPDHPTPCELRTHTSDPIPFLIWYPGIEPDEVQTYDEISACNGSYGVLKEDEFIKEFMK